MRFEEKCLGGCCIIGIAGNQYKQMSGHLKLHGVCQLDLEHLGRGVKVKQCISKIEANLTNRDVDGECGMRDVDMNVDVNG